MHYFRVLFLVTFCKLIPCNQASAQMNPQYVAQVGGEWSGLMKKGLFLAQSGVRAYRKMNSSHWEPLTVDSFTVSVFRDTSLVFTFKNIGNIFSEDLKVHFKTMIPGDNVVIFDIYSTDAGNKKLFLQPLEYLIE